MLRKSGLKNSSNSSPLVSLSNRIITKETKRILALELESIRLKNQLTKILNKTNRLILIVDRVILNQILKPLITSLNMVTTNSSQLRTLSPISKPLMLSSNNNTNSLLRISRPTEPQSLTSTSNLLLKLLNKQDLLVATLKPKETPMMISLVEGNKTEEEIKITVTMEIYSETNKYQIYNFI